MRYAYALSFILAVVSGCGDYSATGPYPPPPPPPPVLLKDVTLSSLPSPFYHFEYDASGRVSAVSFASGLRMYSMTYSGDRLTEVDNDVNVNHDRLQYVYGVDGNVDAVKYLDASGVFTFVGFTYSQGRLTEVERDIRVTGGFIIDKVMTFSYDADGNLRELSEHRPAITGRQDETTTVDHFEQYDTGINVDAFSLIHDEFFDHLILLPGVQLQRGNPRRVTRTGDGLNYVVDYTYTYDERNRPVTRTGALRLTNGERAGEILQLLGQFSYY
ncbi:MAG TPA: hypothetical protein VFT29_03325 [Gemmatimonadaceae bacterium]|nr:hypothetical protein [Gemmatimonadaceae bacterium]